MSELPSGWQYESIHSIVKGGLIADGDWVESKDQDPDGKVRLIQLADVGDGDFRDRSDRWMNNEQATRLNVNYLQPGDLLMARMPDPLGRTCMVPENFGRAVTAVDVAIIRITRIDISPKFIMWLLNSPGIRQQIEMLASGTTRRRITRKNLGTIDLPIPPIVEQLRIVEIVEDHLFGLDVALADVNRAKNLLVRLNRSTLENLIKPENDWVETTIGEISSTIRNGIFVSRPSSEPAGIPILRIGSVRAMNLELNNLRYTGLSESNSKIVGNLLNTGDLLFTRYNGNPEYVAACAEVPNLPSPMTHPDKLIRVVLNKELAYPSFVAMSCSGGLTRSYLRSKVKTTAGQAGISGTELKSAKISLPPMEEQIRRANQYQNFIAEQQSLNSTVQTSIKNSENLRRSLLQAAFTGQLTRDVANV